MVFGICLSRTIALVKEWSTPTLGSKDFIFLHSTNLFCCCLIKHEISLSIIVVKGSKIFSIQWGSMYVVVLLGVKNSNLA